MLGTPAEAKKIGVQRPRNEPKCYGTLAEAQKGDAPKSVQSTCKYPGFLRSWDSEIQGEQQEQTKSMIQMQVQEDVQVRSQANGSGH